MSKADDRRIGSMAVRRGLLSKADLEEAVARFEKLQATGSRVPLGEFLVKDEYISRRQLESLLKRQGLQKTHEYVPGYEFIRRIGHGAMGDVYLARQKSMDRMVAMKILPPRLARDKEYTERFLREARLAGRLDHVNAVRGVDAGEHDGRYYFVMEYIEGRSLDDVLKDGGAVSEELALRMIVQVARVLSYAHEHSIIHRDVKPGNILVTTDGVAKLCDLGLAKRVDTESQMTMTGMMMGTPHYMSPEQARGEKDVDARSDIYSLGATLYHLVTGRTPFEGETTAAVVSRHVTEDLSWSEEMKSKVSKNCRRLISRMMARDVDHRYQSAAEVVADMERVMEGKPLATQVPAASRTAAAARAVAARAGDEGTPTERRHAIRSRRRRSRAAVWGIVAALAAAVGAVVLSGGISSREPVEEQNNPSSPEAVDEEPLDVAKAKKLYEDACAWAAQHPEDFDGALQRFREVKDHNGGSQWRVKTANMIHKLKMAKAAASKSMPAPAADPTDTPAPEPDPAPAPKEAPAPTPGAGRYSREIVGALFRGEIHAYDPATCAIELDYDFDDPSQAEDWTATGDTEVRIEGASLRYRSHGLYTRGTMVLHKGSFVRGPLTVTYAARFRDGRQAGVFTFFRDAKNYVSIDLNPGKPRVQVRSGGTAHGRVYDGSAYELPKDTWVKYRFAFAPAGLNVFAGDTEVFDITFSNPAPLGALQVGWTGYSRGDVDNLQITGTLNPCWIRFNTPNQ